MMVTFLLAYQLAEELQNGPLQEDERELLLLLSTPHLKVQTDVEQCLASVNLLFSEDKCNISAVI